MNFKNLQTSICARVATACLVSPLLITDLAHGDMGSDPLFASDDIIEVRIAAPFRTIMHEGSIEEETPANFLFVGSDGGTVRLDAGIRSRGRFRRRPDICDFTPLRLNFKKSQVKRTLFDHQDKLKLVTHCNNNSPRYEQIVLSEYLASVFHYFIGNTDYSPVTTVPGENCCHNHALFANEDGTIYSVPYDFDMSGFVNAPYAAPNPRFRLRNVRERVSAPCRAQQKKATSNEVACLAKPSKSRGLIHQRILKIRTSS